MEFMPEYAPLVVLAFLGSCFALGVTGVVIVYGLARRKRRQILLGLAMALAGAGIYAGLLLVASFSSKERVLSLGEQKYFCEIDCHLAYSVVDVVTTRALGTPPNQVIAAGTFYVVSVKTWFDEKTISAHRGNATLAPNPRRVMVVDDAGRQFASLPEGSKAFELERRKLAPLTRPLRPGESYVTELVFDLPGDAKNPQLLITDADRITSLLIGHENSPFDKEIFFRLTSAISRRGREPSQTHS